ncbi:MAG TPA: glycoside hydrolase family 31 protein, partial [Actinotalea sp.]|nr:glycoside hydrolase family 31 protein [Actinotalea sp.]
MTITHRPAGAGHPYALSPDQRHPVLPVAGEPVRLGVLAPGAVAVSCEWEDLTRGGCTVLPLDAADPAVDLAALAGGDGHLAEAQAAAQDPVGSWQVTTGALAAGRHRYRFVARQTGSGEEVTEWFETQAATWSTEGGVLRVGGSTDHPRLDRGSVCWLADDVGVHRVRFGLRLEPGEHVVGFGERFDALDQRGRCLDAVVFEQYKAQGEHGRTYLPMPFAHVVGGGGRGLPLRTSRRTWYDVAASTPDLLVVEAALGGGPHEELEVAVYDGDPAAVISAFTAEAGRAEELPDWVLRLWASGNEWNTQAIVMDRMDTHRDLDIPVGAVVIEAWSDEQGITILRDARYEVRADGSPRRMDGFTFPPDGAWPDPAGMVDELHRRGVKVVLWQIPLLKTERTLALDDQDWQPEETRQVLADGAELVRGGHVVREADGSPYLNRGWWFPQSLMADLSTAEGRAAWTAYREYLVRELDV